MLSQLRPTLRVIHTCVPRCHAWDSDGKVAPNILPCKVGAQRRADELQRQIWQNADRMGRVHDASRNNPQLTRGKEKDCDLWQDSQEHEDVHMSPMR